MDASRSLTYAAAGAVLLGGAAWMSYRRDTARGRRRLEQYDRRVARTAWGPMDYCSYGKGPPVLMVHGIVGGYDVGPTWRALVPDGYRIITPSRFGYFSAPLTAESTPAAQADAFAALLDELGIEQAFVLGFSAGSTSAVQFALRHPERTLGLVLCCPNSPHPEPLKLPPRFLGPLIFGPGGFWVLRHLARPVLEQLAGIPKEYPRDPAVDADIESVFDSFLPTRPRVRGIVYDAFVGNQAIADYPFEQVDVPTLVVHANDDPAAPHDDARAMAARIPGARFVSLVQGGHSLMHREARARDEIAGFLSTHVPSRGASAPEPEPAAA